MDYLPTAEPLRGKSTPLASGPPRRYSEREENRVLTHTFHEEVKFSGTTSHFEDPGGLTKVRNSRVDNKVYLTRYIYPFQPSNQGYRNSNVSCLV
jgi:hypothetical protein